MTVDTRGLACPQPVVMTRNALAKDNKVDVLVDNVTAKNNVIRFASNHGCTVSVEAAENVDEWIIKIEK